MVGNHRDAWVYRRASIRGAGTAATLEMCHALGAAVEHGWKPRRTLVYASWDAEEYGLVGSTEWTEDHAPEIDKKTVLLLNVDSAVSGHQIDIDGVPSLRDWVLDAAAAVTDVRSGKTLRRGLASPRSCEHWAGQDPVDLPDLFSNGNGISSDSAAARPAPRFFPQMAPLGSGSDYTVFLDHLGVPAIDAGFSGRYGVYHSVYDNFTWMEKVGDPEFITHGHGGAVLHRARDAGCGGRSRAPEVRPLWRGAARLHRRCAAADRAQVRGRGPAANGLLNFAGLAGLVKAVRSFQDQAAALDHATDDLAHRDGVPREKLARVNDALTRIERAFLLPGGLPGRPWFAHAIYAPGLTTGYTPPWPLPGPPARLSRTRTPRSSPLLRMPSRPAFPPPPPRSRAAAGRRS